MHGATQSSPGHFGSIDPSRWRSESLLLEYIYIYNIIYIYTFYIICIYIYIIIIYIYMFLNGHFVKAVDISRHTLRGPLSLFGFSTCLKRVIDLALFLSRFKN